MKPLSALVAAGLLAATCLVAPASAAQPVPDKLVVLTFDDSCASHHAIAAPLLKRHGFGATFFITEGFTFRTNPALERNQFARGNLLQFVGVDGHKRDGAELGADERVAGDRDGRFFEAVLAHQGGDFLRNGTG